MARGGQGGELRWNTLVTESHGHRFCDKPVLTFLLISNTLRDELAWNDVVTEHPAEHSHSRSGKNRISALRL